MNFGVLLYHEVNELAAFGIYSIIAMAAKISEQELNLFTLAKSRKSIITDGALIVTPQYAFASSHSPDVLIIPGGAGVFKAAKNKQIADYLLRLEPNLKLLITVSSGAVLAAELGFLKDKHIAAPDGLSDYLESYELMSVSDKRLVKDAKLWSGSSPSSSLDLGLELILEFYGAELASKVAKSMGIPEQGALF